MSRDVLTGNDAPVAAFRSEDVSARGSPLGQHSRNPPTWGPRFASPLVLALNTAQQVVGTRYDSLGP
jgi:hypothetical protein